MASAGLALLLGWWGVWGRPAGYALCLALLATLAGLTWRQSRMYADVETLYQTTLAENPDCWMIHNNLGLLLTNRGEMDEAMAHYRKALEIKPDYAKAYNNLAWLRATSSKASIRNGKEAVELAQRAVRLSDGQEPIILDTLAAAYAEAGRFTEAVETARKAVDLAGQQNKPALADSIQARITLYEAQNPFREMNISKERAP